jgi:hypothetical protein
VSTMGNGYSRGSDRLGTVQSCLVLNQARRRKDLPTRCYGYSQ